jgi:hypothetical protein
MPAGPSVLPNNPAAPRVGVCGRHVRSPGNVKPHLALAHLLLMSACFLAATDMKSTTTRAAKDALD